MRSPAATGRPPGATDTTSSIGPTADPPRSPTWCCSAGTTTAPSTTTTGRSESINRPTRVPAATLDRPRPDPPPQPAAPPARHARPTRATGQQPATHPRTGHQQLAGRCDMPRQPRCSWTSRSASTGPRQDHIRGDQARRRSTSCALLRTFRPRMRVRPTMMPTRPAGRAIRERRPNIGRATRTIQPQMRVQRPMMGTHRRPTGSQRHRACYSHNRVPDASTAHDDAYRPAGGAGHRDIERATRTIEPSM